jgi:hypothetical protein
MVFSRNVGTLNFFSVVSKNYNFVLVSFPSCDKIPEINNLKEDKVCSGSQFQRF